MKKTPLHYFLFPVSVIPLCFPTEKKISFCHYYFFCPFPLLWSSPWGCPLFRDLNSPSMALGLPGCPPKLARHKLLAEPDPYRLQAPLALFSAAKPRADVAEVWWEGPGSGLGCHPHLVPCKSAALYHTAPWFMWDITYWCLYRQQLSVSEESACYKKGSRCYLD